MRMSKDTFDFLCHQLQPHIEKQCTILRAPISVPERVAVTIWRLATNIEYRTLSELFGIGRSTVGEIVNETCDAICKHLLPQYVRIPQGDSLREIIEGFCTHWGFPQTVGAIDGTHIPILRPQESASDYYNRKGYYSIIMQALVDHRGLFMDIYSGWPGKVHDARVFVNSALYRKAINNKLLPDWSENLCGVEVPLIILGDPAYPALPWLMKPYVENAQTSPEAKYFNYRQSRARMVVENSFGRLKGRWRCLLKRMDCQLQNVNKIVGSCVVLHNICELVGDRCLEEWIHHEPAAEFRRLGNIPSVPQPASNIRNAIKEYLSSSNV